MEAEKLQLRRETFTTQQKESTQTSVPKYWPLSRKQQLFKRTFDLFITVLSLPFILPIGIITAIMIKLETKGPVFFVQERVGKFGNTFKMVKFRSMTTDAEENGSKFASKDDNRITRVGKFIRRYRIDEIPNFWNVMQGDMSVIGPRPEQINFVEFFNSEIDRYHYRHSVKPGITGWAQVHQGYAACMRSTQTKLNYDLFYIRNYSFKLDFLIILKTFITISTGFGSR